VRGKGERTLKDAITFKVYPESVHGLWFECSIHPSVRSLRQAVKEQSGNPTGSGVRGMVQHFRRVRKGRMTKQLGHIHLVKSELHAEVLSHESTHAALNWARAMNIDVTDQSADVSGFAMSEDSGEERFAYAVGRICSQLSHMVWEHNLVSN
jgi:hypothetical protein